MSALQDAITANPARYEGYTVTPQNEDNDNAQTSYSIVRNLDGTGLGAYATIERTEEIIAADRRMITTMPGGVEQRDFIPPVVNPDPETFYPAPNPNP